MQVASLTRQLSARRKSLRFTLREIRTRWKVIGNHTKDDRHEFNERLLRIGEEFRHFGALLFEDGLTRTLLYLNLSEPAQLDEQMKRDYLAKLMAYLRQSHDAIIPTLKRVLDSVNIEVKQLDDFVDSCVPLKEADKAEEPDAFVPVAEEENRVDNYVPDDDDEIDNDALRILTRDEFFDDPEYRRIVRMSIEKTVVPAAKFMTELNSLTELQSQGQRMFLDWSSRGVHPTEKMQWLSKHFTMATEFSLKMTEMMQSMTSEAKVANRKFKTAIDHDSSSLVPALAQLTETRLRLVEEILPQMRGSLEQQIKIAKEIVEYIEDDSEGRSAKKRRPFWRKDT